MSSSAAASASHTITTRGLDEVVAVETPEQVVFSYTVAGIGSRAAAALIDYGLIFLGLLLIWLVYAFVLGPVLSRAHGASLLARHTGAWVLAVVLILQFVAMWGYYVLFEALWDGQTPGKRWLRLRVVQDGGYSVSFAASAARNIARILDMQPGIAYLAGLIALAVSRTGKRIGDQVAGTIVVRERIVPVSADAPAAGEPTTPASLQLTAALTDAELDLLERFLERAASLDPARLDALTQQLTARFRAQLPATTQPASLPALHELAQRERAARASGVSARGDTGAARERYALLAEGEARWSRFAAMLSDAQRRGLRHMSGAEVAAFVAAYREIATDLARLSTAAHGRELDALFRLSRLVAGGHNLLYRRERVAPRAFLRFVFVGIPVELRRSWLPILSAALLFFASATATFIATTRDPRLIDELIGPGMIDRAEVDAARARSGDARYIDVEDYVRPALASSIMRNNVQVTFLAFASGLTAGVLTLLLLISNGVSIGAAVGLFATHGIARIILDFVIAHSVFELSAICIAAGGGFLIAGGLLLPGPRTRREALVAEGRRALRLLGAATLLLVCAGTIEGLISPRTDVPFALKALIAGSSALVLALWWNSGRQSAPPPELR